MRKPFPGVWVSLLLVVLVAAGQLGLGWLFRDLLNSHALLAVSVVNLVVLGGVCAAGFVLAREAPSWGRGKTASPLLFAALPITALGGAVALGFFADVLTRIFPLPAQFARMLQDMLEGPPAEAVLALVFIAPLTEELLFRGLILRGLERRYGFVPALLISSALFALSHFNLVQALPAFAAGLYLGWLYRSTGTLWWSMAAHGLFNGTSLALALAFPGTDDGSSIPWPLAVPGAIVLALGLWLTRRSIPLSPPKVSDTVAP